MRGIKRTVRRFGPVRGHRDGLTSDRLLTYEEARRRIYLPAYLWVLENTSASTSSTCGRSRAEHFRPNRTDRRLTTESDL